MLVEEDGQRQPDGVLEKHADDGEEEGVPQGRGEDRIRDDGAKIAEPDESRMSADERRDGVVPQAQIDVAVQGVGVEREQIKHHR